jgi:hypothetical protein
LQGLPGTEVLRREVSGGNTRQPYGLGVRASLHCSHYGRSKCPVGATIVGLRSFATILLWPPVADV